MFPLQASSPPINAVDRVFARRSSTFQILFPLPLSHLQNKSPAQAPSACHPETEDQGSRPRRRPRKPPPAAHHRYRLPPWPHPLHRRESPEIGLPPRSAVARRARPRAAILKELSKSLAARGALRFARRTQKICTEQPELSEEIVEIYAQAYTFRVHRYRAPQPPRNASQPAHAGRHFGI